MTAAAAEDGGLLELTSPCQVTSAERSHSVKIRRSSGFNSTHNASLHSEHAVDELPWANVTLPGQFETVMSIHYGFIDRRELEAHHSPHSAG